MNGNNGHSFNNVRFNRVTFGNTISPKGLAEYLRAGPEDQANSEGAVRFADDESLICRQQVSTPNDRHANSSAR